MRALLSLRRAPRPCRCAPSRAGIACVLVLGTSLLLAAQPVTVRTDANGLVQLEGTSDTRVIEELGFEHMRAMPVSTLVNLWRHSGRTAEWRGALPGRLESALRRDRSSLAWRIPERAAARHAPRILADPDLGPLLRAYVRGIERGRLRWLQTPFALQRLMGINSAEGLQEAALRRLFNRTIQAARVVELALGWISEGSRAQLQALLGRSALTTPFGVSASNAIALPPSATSDGQATLIADPHLPADLSWTRPWFGTLRGRELHGGGWWIPGLPFPLVGFNRDVAWTAVTNPIDAEDAWEASKSGPDTIALGSTSQTILRARPSYRIFDRGRQRERDYPLALAWADAATRDLPILEEGPDPTAPTGPGRVVFAGAGFTQAPRTLLEATYGLLRARDLVDAESTLDEGGVGGQAIIATAADGATGLFWTAHVPQRPPAMSLALADAVLDGNDPNLRWSGGLVPASSLPRAIRPPSPGLGALVNCNVSPWLSLPTSFPANAATWPVGVVDAPPIQATHRQRRAEALVAQGPLDANGLRGLATDQRDSWLIAVLPYLNQSLAELSRAGFPVPALQSAVLQWIGAWDGQARSASPEAAWAYLFRARFEQLARDAVGFGLSLDLRILAPYEDWPPLATLRLGGAQEALVLGLALAALQTTEVLYPGLVTFTLASPAQNTWSWLAPVSPFASLARSRIPTDPFGSLRSGALPQLPRLGHIRWMDLQPGNAPPAEGARFPIGGAKDALFFLGSEDLASTLRPGIAANRLLFGSTRTLIVRFTPNGPRAELLAPLGNGELRDDPRRLLLARAYAERRPLPLRFSAAEWSLPGAQVRVEIR